MTRVTSKPQGRPVSTGRGHNGRKIAVRVSEEEARAYRLAAGDAGLTVAEWMRHAAAARLAQRES